MAYLTLWVIMSEGLDWFCHLCMVLVYGFFLCFIIFGKILMKRLVSF